MQIHLDGEETDPHEEQSSERRDHDRRNDGPKLIEMLRCPEGKKRDEGAGHVDDRKNTDDANDDDETREHLLVDVAEDIEPTAAVSRLLRVHDLTYTVHEQNLHSVQ